MTETIKPHVTEDGQFDAFPDVEAKNGEVTRKKKPKDSVPARWRLATQEPAKPRPGDPGTPEAVAAVEAARYLVEQMSNPYHKRRSVEG